MIKMKTRTLFIIYGVVLIIVTIFLIGFRGKAKVNNWILAYSTITLVFVTIYYAVQTYKLYSESQKKRYADFWERRIAEFYMPFIVILNNITDSMAENNIKTLHNLHNELVKLFWGKRYMISDETAEKIKRIFPYILMARDDSWRDRLFQEYRRSEETIRKLIIDEWKIIEGQIRKLYGIEEKEDENLQRQ